MSWSAYWSAWIGPAALALGVVATGTLAANVGIGRGRLREAAAGPQQDSMSRAWNRPVTPFRIVGNLYYVGAADVTSFLVVTRAGLVLIDGGFEQTAPQVLANVRRLGFDPRGIRYLLSSHAHLDHAGGLAALRAATGARVVAGAEDAPLLERGGRRDFAFGDRLPFPPVRVDRRVRDGDVVQLGDVTLTAHHTPGHTRGCTTWSTPVTDGRSRHSALFLCSVSVPSEYALVDNHAYPEIARDYARTFAALRAVSCDVFLGSHGVFFDLTEKRAALAAGARPNPFVDPGGCRAFLRDSEARFTARLQAARDSLGGAARR